MPANTRQTPKLLHELDWQVPRYGSRRSRRVRVARVGGYKVVEFMGNSYSFVPWPRCGLYRFGQIVNSFAGMEPHWRTIRLEASTPRSRAPKPAWYELDILTAMCVVIDIQQRGAGEPQ